MKVLIISFDGLEHTLVEKFNCKTLMQKEYGKTDLTPYFEGGGHVMPLTVEVYATILTGWTPNGHGINVDLQYALTLSPHPLPRKYLLLAENIPNILKFPLRVLAVEIPNVNQSFVHRKLALNLRDFLTSKISLETLENDCYAYAKYIMDAIPTLMPDKDLMFIYFSFTDILGHAYFEGHDKLRKMYKCCEDIVDKLINCIEDKEETLILILSDHGMINGKHTKYGFWSSNKSLGLGESIKVTDWYNIIKKSCDVKTKEDIMEHLTKLGYF